MYIHASPIFKKITFQHKISRKYCILLLNYVNMYWHWLLIYYHLSILVVLFSIFTSRMLLCGLKHDVLPFYIDPMLALSGCNIINILWGKIISNACKILAILPENDNSTKPARINQTMWRLKECNIQHKSKQDKIWYFRFLNWLICLSW